MSQEIVAQVRAKYPTPLGEKHPDFLIEVAKELKLGLVSKTAGTRIVLPDGRSVSQDVVMDQNGNAWDILRDGEGDAIPVFNQIGNIDPFRYTNVVALTSSPAAPGQTEPQSPSAIDLAMFEKRLASLETTLDELRSSQASLNRGQESISILQQALLTKLDDLMKKPVAQFSVKFPNYVGRFFGATVVLRPEDR